MRVDAGATVPLTYVPPFPTYPPETAWMRQERSDIPALILSEHGAARVAYMPADIDRRYSREHLPDHANLLANVIRWAVKDQMPVRVEGPGLIDCHMYRQGTRTILHLVNLTSAATWRAPLEELIPVGPLNVRFQAPLKGTARFLVAGTTTSVRPGQTLVVGPVLDHEVIVVE
jgi:hypothetical protein